MWSRPILWPQGPSGGSHPRPLPSGSGSRSQGVLWGLNNDRSLQIGFGVTLIIQFLHKFRRPLMYSVLVSCSVMDHIPRSYLDWSSSLKMGLLVGCSPSGRGLPQGHRKHGFGWARTILLCQQARGFSKDGTSPNSSHSHHFAVTTQKCASVGATGFLNPAKLKIIGCSVNPNSRL